MNTARARLIVALAVLAVTLVAFALTERYQLEKAQILRNGDFSAGLENWRVSNNENQLALEQGVLHIRSKHTGQAPGIRQRVQREAGVKRLRLSAWVRHTDVTIGLRPWNAMRLMLVPKDADGNSLPAQPQVVEQGRGDSPWHLASKVFWLPPRVDAVEVVVILSRVTGEMAVRDLSLDVVQQRPIFNVMRYSLIAVWLLLLPWLAWPLCRAGRRRYGRLAVAILSLAILVGALTPHIAKNELSRLTRDLLGTELAITAKALLKTTVKPAAAVIASEVSGNGDTSVPIGQIWLAGHKLGHLGLFALLALVTTLAWRGQSWQRLGLYLFAFAITAEALQLLSLDRSAHPLDAGLNILGAAAGLALGSRLFPRRAEAVTVPDPPNA
ncbi:MAG: hypothetical protein HOA08_00735 [Rhodospirillaceae bacterium]|jgi:hypothetical protein|nr:hypothetical protein [Rhodospirillaceae bacterium]MBT3493114.1 hypothetical protein [Rhodospirillaceae bacterium]MBT3779914.1 hypothetical protein [Rhodospirillaceae bacterium]MBT3977042.1 hypothetical protein [Rhodospirillaceae bacterium]MBT4166647.1 hypothetical protein [Rhodospirillaceae bacterium]